VAYANVLRPSAAQKDQEERSKQKKEQGQSRREELKHKLGATEDDIFELQKAKKELLLKKSMRASGPLDTIDEVSEVPSKECPSLISSQTSAASVDAKTALSIGACFEYGFMTLAKGAVQHTEKDFLAAEKWYKAALEKSQGDGEAEFRLGRLYQTNMQFQKTDEATSEMSDNAFNMYVAAARKKHPKAQLTIGEIKEQGEFSSGPVTVGLSDGAELEDACKIFDLVARQGKDLEMQLRARQGIKRMKKVVFGKIGKRTASCTEYLKLQALPPA
jgi:hypothetical protein